MPGPGDLLPACREVLGPRDLFSAPRIPFQGRGILGCTWGLATQSDHCESSFGKIPGSLHCSCDSGGQIQGWTALIGQRACAALFFARGGSLIWAGRGVTWHCLCPLIGGVGKSQLISCTSHGEASVFPTLVPRVSTLMRGLELEPAVFVWGRVLANVDVLPGHVCTGVALWEKHV